jgi:hypothetical protein
MSRGLGQGARGTGGAAWTAAFGGRRACAAASGFGPHINSGRAGARPSKGAGARPSKGAGARPSKGAGARPSKGAGARPSKDAGARPSKDAGACLLVPHLVHRASCAIP